MKLKQAVSAEIVQRVGRYETVLDRVEEKPGKFDRPVSAWIFRVEGDGPEAGKEIVLIAGTNLRVGTSLHQLAEQLLGRTISVGAEVDLTGVIGQRFEIATIPSGDGVVASVESIKPLNDKE